MTARFSCPPFFLKVSVNKPARDCVCPQAWISWNLWATFVSGAALSYFRESDGTSARRALPFLSVDVAFTIPSVHLAPGQPWVCPAPGSPIPQSITENGRRGFPMTTSTMRSNGARPRRKPFILTFLIEHQTSRQRRRSRWKPFMVWFIPSRVPT